MSDFVNPPPSVQLFPYPAVTAVAALALMTTILLIAVRHFDPTRGPLTISLLIVLAMMGAVAYTLIFSVPADDLTPSIVGGLTAGFGAVVAYWLGRQRNGRPPDEPPSPPKPPFPEA